MDNLKTSLVPPVNKACGNYGRSILERFIKPRSSIIVLYPKYSLDRPVLSIAAAVPHEDF